MQLKRSFPKKTPVGLELSFKACEVSFSSSFMKTLASPLIAAKKITIHTRPDRILLSIISSPMENLMIDIVTITNIKSELITYLFLTSDLMSFLKIVTEVLMIDNSYALFLKTHCLKSILQINILQC